MSQVDTQLREARERLIAAESRHKQLMSGTGDFAVMPGERGNDEIARLAQISSVQETQSAATGAVQFLRSTQA